MTLSKASQQIRLHTPLTQKCLSSSIEPTLISCHQILCVESIPHVVVFKHIFTFILRHAIIPFNIFRVVICNYKSYIYNLSVVLKLFCSFIHNTYEHDHATTPAPSFPRLSFLWHLFGEGVVAMLPKGLSKHHLRHL